MNSREIYNLLLTHYLFISLMISGLTFAIVLFFTTKVKWLPLDFFTLTAIIPMSILIVYQCFFIKNTYSNIGFTFGELCPLFQYNYYGTFSEKIKRKLQKSWLFYVTIILVIAPFVIIEVIRIYIWKLGSSNPPSYFYLHESTTWALLLDIFNHLITYLILFMLGIIIWLLIELIFIINGLLDKDKQNKYKVKINVFKVEEIGGLKPLNSFVLFTVSNYFIIIALFVISYIPPNETNFYNILITPEIVILILMLLIGVILFFITQEVIRKLIDDSVRLELERTNKNYQEAYEKVIEICSNKKTNDDKYELEKLQVTMNILEKEKTKINQILGKKFESKTMSTFFTSFIPPSYVLIQKITGLNISDNLLPYIIHIINIKIGM